MSYNRDTDQDLFVDLVSAWQKENPKYIEARNASLKKPPIAYKKDSKEKPNGYTKILIASFLLITLGFTAGIKTVTAIENNKAYNTAVETFSKDVHDNLHYGDYNYENNERIWWYGIPDMAEGILNKADDKTIDVQIYSSYLKLKAYNKISHMNELFSQMQRIVNNNPNDFSDKIKRIANCNNYEEYINSTGLTKEEYERTMEDLLKEFGKKINNTEIIDKLLQNLDGDNIKNRGESR